MDKLTLREYEEAAAKCQTVSEAEEKLNAAPPRSLERQAYYERIRELNMIQDIKDAAATCKTAAEAEKLYRTVSQKCDNCLDQKIYHERWVELADIEAPAKAEACVTIKEIKQLRFSAPQGSQAEKIFHKKWIEFADAEVPVQLETCRTIDAAKLLWEHAPKGSRAEALYHLRWERIADETADEQARRCMTVLEAVCRRNLVPEYGYAYRRFNTRIDEICKTSR